MDSNNTPLPEASLEVFVSMVSGTASESSALAAASVLGTPGLPRIIERTPGIVSLTDAVPEVRSRGGGRPITALFSSPLLVERTANRRVSASMAPVSNALSRGGIAPNSLPEPSNNDASFSGASR